MDKNGPRKWPSWKLESTQGLGPRAMTVFSVHHTTTYRYKKPVRPGRHQMLFRPRDSFDQRLLESRIALREYAETIWMPTSTFLIQSERSSGMSPQAIVNLFWRWYRHVGFDGCSSHSGRRTFITNTARKISTVGGSLRDVQMLAGHTNLRTTQRYIEANPEAQIRIVELV